jgi:hypothetical protein
MNRCSMTTGIARTHRFAWRNKHRNRDERLIATEPSVVISTFLHDRVTISIIQMKVAREILVARRSRVSAIAFALR